MAQRKPKRQLRRMARLAVANLRTRQRAWKQPANWIFLLALYASALFVWPPLASFEVAFVSAALTTRFVLLLITRLEPAPSMFAIQFVVGRFMADPWSAVFDPVRPAIMRELDIAMPQ
jgi:hypothetical protein